MRGLPRDKNAPKKPLSAFNLFMKQRRVMSNELASKSFAERNRIIGFEWSKLSAEEKQVFHDNAANDRQLYRKAFDEYKQTDDYKKWLSQQGQTTNKTKSKMKNQNAKMSSTPNVRSESDEFKIPIFTKEFLEYNRLREILLRQLKKQASQLEEETASLSKHVETVSNAELRVKSQIESVKEVLKNEESLMKTLRKEITIALKQVSLPTNANNNNIRGTQHITEDSVDLFLQHLCDLGSTAKMDDARNNIANAYQNKQISLFTV